MSLIDQIMAAPSGAIFGEGGEASDYRYLLWRDVNPQTSGIVVFIGLNPSTATAILDDPTIRRCKRFTKDWGKRYYVMLNIFAYRATDPQAMKQVINPYGPENASYLTRVAKLADIVVAAWGVHGEWLEQGARVTRTLQAIDVPLKCLGKTKDGHPRHPLYVRADAQLIDYP